ncbi:MAG: hypothetical protein JWL83_1271 [Actinomycetia bacterium]|nr:hypothetical protein [Actinomycetes bacterium]
MTKRAFRREEGFVAIEFAVAVGLLLLPVVLLVAALPSWVERQHAASVAAREAAAVAVRAFPQDGLGAAVAAAEETVANYGIPADAIDVTFDRVDLRRGGTVSARVTIEMPAVVVPGMGTAGGFHWSVVRSRRIDDYRSG